MKVLIPESWSDITLTQFQNYTAEFKKELNPTTRLIQLISIFCDIKFDVACKMKISDMKKIAKDIYALLQITPNTLITTFEHNKIKYGFIPRLDDITIGEYADLEHYLSDADKMWDNMHWIVSILYREIEEEKNGKYVIKDYEPSKERAEEFKNLSMEVVYSASNFFLSLGAELVEIMPNFIQPEEKLQMTEILKKMAGVGSKSSTISQEEILQDLNRLKDNN